MFWVFDVEYVNVNNVVNVVCFVCFRSVGNGILEWEL